MSFVKPLAVFLFASVALAAPSANDVWITRADGSLQCDEKPDAAHAKAVAQAKTELEKAGVKVLEAQKRNDGRLRAQSCGIATGDETSFRIPKHDLAKAKRLGFEAMPASSTSVQ